MFNNIGGKIKGLAVVTFIIEAIVGVIGGIALIAEGGDDEMLMGFLLLILVPLFAWISSWLLYGFGQLIQNSDVIAEDYKRKNYEYNKKSYEQAQYQQRNNINSFVANPNVAGDAYVDCICPRCRASLSFTREQLHNYNGFTCPECGTYTPSR